jgi:putative aldouronate transport system substrate-binding protein
LSYPKTSFKSVTQTPGSGSDVTWLSYTIVPNAPVEDNPAWQEVNKQVRATLKMQLVPYADYMTRLNTVLAGADVPDVVYLTSALPAMDRLMSSTFADLTPYLSGDAVKDYPNLANLPTVAWKQMVFNNAIYAVPTAYMRFFWMLWAHQELLDQVGAPLPTTADDFKRLVTQLNNPQGGVWGIGTQTNNAFDIWTTSGGLYAAMFGAPNQWAESAGKFTRTFETEQFKAAVGFARDMYAAGVYHPNSASNTILQARTDFTAGKFLFHHDGMTIDLWNQAKAINPVVKLRQPVPPAGDGSKGHYWYGPGIFGFTAINKRASADRVKEILRIMNYLAAPIGSEEYLLLHYGMKGTDWDYDDKGNPTLTDKGKADTMPWGAGTVTVPNPPQILFDPQDPQFAQVIQGDQKQMGAVGVSDASLGLYSNTNASKGNVLNQNMLDGLAAIVTGTQSLDSFEQLVKDWRANGGDQIRSELEQAFAASND